MIFFIVCGLIFSVRPTFYLIAALTQRLIYRRRMFIFHYVEYTYDGKRYTTRENGALNDLAGVGLLLEIEKRGGVVDLHRTGNEIEIEDYIDYRYLQQQTEAIPCNKSII